MIGIIIIIIIMIIVIIIFIIIIIGFGLRQNKSQKEPPVNKQGLSENN